jgi:hypothetical protein
LIAANKEINKSLKQSKKHYEGKPHKLLDESLEMFNYAYHYPTKKFVPPGKMVQSQVFTPPKTDIEIGNESKIIKLLDNNDFKKALVDGWQKLRGFKSYMKGVGDSIR